MNEMKKNSKRMSGSEAKLNNLAEDLNPAPQAIVQPAGKDGGPRSAAEFGNTPLRDMKATAEQHPADFSRKGDAKEDTRQTTKLELQDTASAPGVTPFGVLQATDKDFDWLKSLREHEAEVNYDAWFASWFDSASPAQKEIALKLDPGFYARRTKLLDEDLALARKVVRLKIFGPQSRDDVILQYAIEAGFVDGDRIENLLHPERAQKAQQADVNQKRYRRGLLNPRRFPRGDWGQRKRETNAQSILGKEESAFGPTPAYRLGTGTDAKPIGFSAVGPVDNMSEALPNFSNQLETMKRVNFQ